MRVRLCELGVKGLVSMAALELVFLATSYSNLFFLLLLFGAVLGCYGLASAIAAVRSVRVAALEVPAAPANAERPVRLVVAARRRVFDLVLRLDGGGAPLELPSVPLLHGEQDLQLVLPPLPRGVRRIRTVVVATRFPFGLCEVSRRLAADAEIVTHPDPACAARAVADVGGGGQAGGRRGEVAGLREFRAGDSLRDVHWRATARTGALIAKEHENGGARTLFVDRHCDAETLEPRLAAATAAVFAASRGTSGALHLRSQGFSAHVAPGAAPPRDVLRWLAAAVPAETAAEARDANGPGGPEASRA